MSFPGDQGLAGMVPPGRDSRTESDDDGILRALDLLRGSAMGVITRGAGTASRASRCTASPKAYVLSYKVIRLAVGFLGVLLPAFLFLGETSLLRRSVHIEGSLIAYYRKMQDVFVGVNWTIIADKLGALSLYLRQPVRRLRHRRARLARLGSAKALATASAQVVSHPGQSAWSVEMTPRTTRCASPCPAGRLAAVGSRRRRGQRRLAGQESPAVIGPEVDSEVRRGRDYVRGGHRDDRRRGRRRRGARCRLAGVQGGGG